MKKILLLLLLVFVLPAVAQEAPLPILVAGRIYAQPDLSIYTNCVNGTDRPNDPFVIVGCQLPVKADAAERLSQALEAIQFLNPDLYNQVMNSYGLQVVPAR